MDPLAFLEILDIFSMFGYKTVHLLYYLIRTYVYYIYRKKQILLGIWTCDNLKTKFHKKCRKKNGINIKPCVSGSQNTVICSVSTTGHYSSPSLAILTSLVVVQPSCKALVTSAVQPSLQVLITPHTTYPGSVVPHCDTAAGLIGLAGCFLAHRDGDVQSAAL